MGADNDLQIPKGLNNSPLSVEGENPGAPKIPFIKKCDRFFGRNKAVFSLITGLTTTALYFTPAGVIDTAGKIMAGATAVAYASLKIFEHTKPRDVHSTSTLNLLHHFVVISLPLTVGLLTGSVLAGFVAKNVLIGISLLASSVYILANRVFPPMNHDKVYRGLGLV